MGGVGFSGEDKVVASKMLGVRTIQPTRDASFSAPLPLRFVFDHPNEYSANPDFALNTRPQIPISGSHSERSPGTTGLLRLVLCSIAISKFPRLGTLFRA